MSYTLDDLVRFKKILREWRRRVEDESGVLRGELESFILNKFLPALSWDSNSDLTKVEINYWFGYFVADIVLKTFEKEYCFFLFFEGEEEVRISVPSGKICKCVFVLTNGILWKIGFFDDFGEFKEFLEFDIRNVNLDDIARMFFEILSVDAALSGLGLKEAHRRFLELDSEFDEEAAINCAIYELFAFPPDWLVDDIRRKVARKLGKWIERKEIVEKMKKRGKEIFERKFWERARKFHKKSASGDDVEVVEVYSSFVPDMSNKKILKFAMLGKEIEVSKWIELLGKGCELLWNMEPEEFEKALVEIKGRKRTYFSRNPDDFDRPALKIGESGIYVIRVWNANFNVRTLRKVMDLMGVGHEKLVLWVYE